MCQLRKRHLCYKTSVNLKAEKSAISYIAHSISESPRIKSERLSSENEWDTSFNAASTFFTLLRATVSVKKVACLFHFAAKASYAFSLCVDFKSSSEINSSSVTFAEKNAFMLINMITQMTITSAATKLFIVFYFLYI